MGRSCQLAPTIAAHGQSIANHANSLSAHAQIFSAHAQSIAEHGASITAQDGVIALQQACLNAYGECIEIARGRQDALEPRVGNLSGRTLIVEREINSIKAAAAALAARLNEPNGSCSIVNLKNRLGTVEGRTNILQNDVNVISGRVNEIDALRRRLALEEEKMHA